MWDQCPEVGAVGWVGQVVTEDWEGVEGVEGVEWVEWVKQAEVVEDLVVMEGSADRDRFQEVDLGRFQKADWVDYYLGAGSGG